MRNMIRGSVSVLALGFAAGALATAAAAQTTSRDGIGDLLKRAPDAATQMAQSQAGQKAAPSTPRRPVHAGAPDKQVTPEKDVREGDPSFEQAQRLMKPSTPSCRIPPRTAARQEAALRGRLPHEAAMDRDTRGPRKEDP
jgi:hypothetical protein